jgi:hypothetical protein
MSIASSTRVVSDDIASLLQRYVTPIRDGKRRISTATLSPPRKRHQQLTHALSTSPERISAEDFAAYYVCENESEVEIPANLESIETLEFIGLNSTTARKVWDWFSNDPDPDLNKGFIETVKFHVDMAEIVPDCVSASDDWSAALIALGINNTLSSAILLLEFSDLRHTRSVKFWVLESLKSAFLALKYLDQHLRDESPRLLAAANSPSKVTRPIMPSSPSPLSRKESLKGKAKGLNTSSSASATPQVTVVATEPHLVDNHTIIFHTCTKAEARSLYETASGKIDLLSRGCVPGDFSGTRPLCYWTPQRETADRYASWLKHRVPVANIAIVQIAVPESLTNSLNEVVLYHHNPLEPSDDWRKVVWYCRNGKDWPREMRDTWAQAEWIRGHILSGVDARYMNMTNWTEIKSSDTLSVEIDGQMKPAMQWVFKGEDGGEAKFEKSCAGKGYIHDLGSFKMALKDLGS